MRASREDLFNRLARELQRGVDGEIKIGGNYTPALAHNGEIFVSGQIPRVKDTLVVTGRAGVDVSLADARYAARICAMRGLAIMRQTLGSLDAIERMPRMTVYVQSGPLFTQQSKVADAASEVFHTVLGSAGTHTRTSVGVYQLPKNAPVEIDLAAAVLDRQSTLPRS